MMLEHVLVQAQTIADSRHEIDAWSFALVVVLTIAIVLAVFITGNRRDPR